MCEFCVYLCFVMYDCVSILDFAIILKKKRKLVLLLLLLLLSYRCIVTINVLYVVVIACFQQWTMSTLTLKAPRKKCI